MEARQAFPFYRSFLTAAERLEERGDQAEYLMAVCRYALDGTEPEGLGAVPGAMFALAKPNLDALRRRRGAPAPGASAPGTEREAPPAPEKETLARYVSLSRREHEELIREYGPEDARRLVEILDDYKGATGRRYESDYRAIRAWCVERLREEKRRAGRAGTCGTSWRTLAGSAGGSG